MLIYLLFFLSDKVSVCSSALLPQPSVLWFQACALFSSLSILTDSLPKAQVLTNQKFQNTGLHFQTSFPKQAWIVSHLFLNLSSPCVCTCVCVCTCARVCTRTHTHTPMILMWKSEDTLWESVFSLHHAGSGDGPWVWKQAFLLSELSYHLWVFIFLLISNCCCFGGALNYSSCLFLRLVFN